MKKSFLAALATGMLVVGMGGVAQANLLQDYNPIVGAPITGFSFSFQNIGGQTAVYDSMSQLIGYDDATDSLYSGIYLGTVTADPQGTKEQDDMQALITYFLNGTPFTSTIWEKVDLPDDPVGSYVDLVNDGITLTVTPDTTAGLAGTWSISPNSYALSFYNVKGTTDWSLYSSEKRVKTPAF